MPTNRMPLSLAQSDPEISAAVQHEVQRQHEGLEMIASENFVSQAVLEAAGSVFTNKYAEGYPGKRYYGGCEFADVVENLARDRAKQLFGAEHANVQPHSGSQANAAAYMAIIQPGDTILGLDLAHGGHLTHGHQFNFSGKLYRVASYGVRKDTEVIDYDELEADRRARKAQDDHRRRQRLSPQLRLRAHAPDRRQSRRLLRRRHGAFRRPGRRRRASLARPARPHRHHHHAQDTARPARRHDPLPAGVWQPGVDRSVFPGQQGGPLMHVIAAKAVAFSEALQPEFKDYAKQIVANAKALAEALTAEGYRIVSGGTDTHLMLVDVFVKGHVSAAKPRTRSARPASPSTRTPFPSTPIRR